MNVEDMIVKLEQCCCGEVFYLSVILMTLTEHLYRWKNQAGESSKVSVRDGIYIIAFITVTANRPFIKE